MLRRANLLKERVLPTYVGIQNEVGILNDAKIFCFFVQELI